jgi:heme-degrading monooxygenase HmoA
MMAVVGTPFARVRWSLMMRASRCSFLSGFLAAQVFVPEDDADGVLVEGSWSSAEHYDRWRGSSAQTELLRDVRHLLAEEPEDRVYHMVDAIS